ncbi:MAG: hypothetical protein LQ349_000103 [Xanthoria aureola]|nr:MAG: hypothetical protein LQ349_000103 [Xanthoria aureola]
MTAWQEIQKPRVLELIITAKIKQERILVLGELSGPLKNLLEYLLPSGPPVDTFFVEHAPLEPLGSDRRYDLIICIGPDRDEPVRDLIPGILRWHLLSWKECLTSDGRIVIQIPPHGETPHAPERRFYEYMAAAGSAGCILTELNGLPVEMPFRQHHKTAYIESLRSTWRLLRRAFGFDVAGHVTTWMPFGPQHSSPDHELSLEEVEAMITPRAVREHIFATIRKH